MTTNFNRFKGQYGPWALVAGASEGLGAAFSEALAIRGLNLVLVARNEDKLRAFGQSLQNRHPVEVVCHPLDLADQADLKNFAEGLREEIGLLVYNAAYSPIGYFKDISVEDLGKIVDVNVKAPLILSKLLSQAMVAKKRGGIILMSSMSGLQGSPKIATYAATKAFNLVLAEGLWSELRKEGVDVLSSCAGAIRTPGYNQSKQSKDAPGTLDADVVAHRTLEALHKGPTVVPGATNKFARFLMSRLLPRKWAIAIMDQNTRHLS